MYFLSCIWPNQCRHKSKWIRYYHSSQVRNKVLEEESVYKHTIHIISLDPDPLFLDPFGWENTCTMYWTYECKYIVHTILPTQLTKLQVIYCSWYRIFPTKSLAEEPLVVADMVHHLPVQVVHRQLTRRPRWQNEYKLTAIKAYIIS